MTTRVGGIELTRLRFPDPAGQYQTLPDISLLVAELGNNYQHYHDFLQAEIGKLPRFRPQRTDYPDIASFLDASQWAEELVKAEAILRKCRAFEQTGRSLAMHDDSGRPLLDANDRLVSVS